ELAETLEYNLIRSGYEVLIAADGLEACRVIGREKPDLILLDLLLPVLDGWEVCRMLRNHHDPLVARIPVVMLSALGATDDRLKGYDLGADLYLPKPYAFKEVRLKIGQLIAQHHEFCQLAHKVSSMKRWGTLQDNWQHVLFHELRNQLTIISGMAQHLMKKTQWDEEHAQQYVQHIHNSSDYLGTLAMNYLMVRQVENDPDQLQLEALNLQDLFNELARLFSPIAKQKDCRLIFDCKVIKPIEVQPVGLKIILSSLIDNALKYAPKGEVEVRAGIKDQTFLIEIIDNGPGIAPEERERVFDKFYRGTTNSEAKGSGLGLYMARTLAASMGGDLRLADQSQGGGHFLLSFAASQKTVA
ncbi:MAG: hybrid sensor histidine kinase/response regulator, partial [Geopsychrobacter sp.]|nr:hybrid sensor histidine kinase/response regulator [Geopsychrobacter sp.]